MGDILYDKVISRGALSLSDEELLALILGGDTTIATAASIISSHKGSLSAISCQSISRLRMCEGIGLKRATSILAAAEWGRRVAMEHAQECNIITSSSDVVDIFRPLLSPLGHEEFWALYLTSSNSIIERLKVSQGGVCSTVVDTKLVIKRGIELLAAQIIVVHNHPSGSALPSGEDRALTDKIRSAAQLFDIALVDHVIISSTEAYSFSLAKLF